MSQLPPELTPWAQMSPPNGPGGTLVASPAPDPEPGPRRDAGSGTVAMIAWAAAAVLLGVLVFLHQFGEVLIGKPESQAVAVEPPGTDPVTMGAKLWIKLAKVLPFDSASIEGAVSQIDDAAETPVDKFRAALAARELAGDDAATSRLDTIETQQSAEDNPVPGLREDIATVRTLIGVGVEGVTDEARKRLEDRHGWFARLAFTSHLAPEDPAREKIVGGGAGLAAAFAFAGLVLLVAFVGGLAAFIVMLVQLSGRRIRPAFIPPAPGGSVYLELLPVFFASFLAFQVVIELVTSGAGSADWAGPVKVSAQWLLLLVTLYPLLRGVRFKEHREAMGWHSGRGFWREVGAGIYGYFAALPLVALAMGLTIVIVVVRSRLPELPVSSRAIIGLGIGTVLGGLGAILAVAFARPDRRPSTGALAGFGSLIAVCTLISVMKLFDGAKGPPSNPVAELLGKASGWMLVLFLALAVIWAPLAEESIFRGAFFRHLRSRVGLGMSALVSAVVFGVMHGYDFVMLAGVITLGFVFALLREWRGSLIAPMTAHALHNGTLLILVTSILGQLSE